MAENLFSKQKVNFLTSAKSKTDRNRRLRAFLQVVSTNAMDRVNPNRGIGFKFTDKEKQKLKTLEKGSLIKLQRLGLSFEGGKKPTDLDAASKLTPVYNPKAKDEGHTKGERGRSGDISFYMEKK